MESWWVTLTAKSVPGFDSSYYFPKVSLSMPKPSPWPSFSYPNTPWSVPEPEGHTLRIFIFYDPKHWEIRNHVFLGYLIKIIISPSPSFQSDLRACEFFLLFFQVIWQYPLWQQLDSMGFLPFISSFSSFSEKVELFVSAWNSVFHKNYFSLTTNFCVLETWWILQTSKNKEVSGLSKTDSLSQLVNQGYSVTKNTSLKLNTLYNEKMCK